MSPASRHFQVQDSEGQTDLTILEVQHTIIYRYQRPVHHATFAVLDYTNLDIPIERSG